MAGMRVAKLHRQEVGSMEVCRVTLSMLTAGHGSVLLLLPVIHMIHVTCMMDGWHAHTQHTWACMYAGPGCVLLLAIVKVLVVLCACWWAQVPMIFSEVVV